jgi:DNA-directed RNA polymerase subunit RPC12/RpoP
MTAFACPHCGRLVAIPDGGQVGQRFRCPHCRQKIALEQRFSRKESEAREPKSARQPAAPLPPDWVALDPPEKTAPDRNAPQSFDFVSAPEEVEREKVEESLDTLSPLGAGGATHGLAAQTVQARKRGRRGRRLILGGVIAGIALVAVIFVWDHFASRRSSAVPVGSTATSNTSAGNAAQASVQTQQNASKEVPSPRPIRLLLAPAGARIVVHLRPSELWSTDPKNDNARPSRGAELRRCLAPLAEWSERQMIDRCLFPPSQIEEVTFALILRSPGDPPDVAATVWLKDEKTAPEIARQFGGRRVERAPLPTWVKGEQALVIRDGKTFALGPQSAAQEMAEANDQPNPTDESIEELLKQSDRSRELTFVFRPDDVDLYRESLFPTPFQAVAHRVAGWLDPEATEGVLLSFQLADPFRIRLAMRNRPATTVHRLEEEVQKHLDQLPAEILANVESLDPRTTGRRKLVGRVPAMWKAVTLGTQSATQFRLAIFDSVLPERAAPNLSLGTYLALSEPRSTAAASKKGRNRKSGTSDQPRTVNERLASKIDVDFRRTPLSEAFSSIGEDIGLTFEIDGGALKIAGYTKNMPQTFRLSGVPAIDALRTILKPYAKMALVVDEPRQTVIVTTLDSAQSKGQKPLGR